MSTNPQSASPNGGRFPARVLAALLALGVLGYLMWRSQAGNKTAPEGLQGTAPAVGEVGDDRANIIELPPMLHSSKSLRIEELPAPAERNGGSTPAEATPAPETPR